MSKCIERPRTGIVCKRQPGKRKYTICTKDEVRENIVLVKAGTEVVKIDTQDVVDQDGNPIRPTWRFWRTASTFDPYHIVVDMP